MRDTAQPKLRSDCRRAPGSVKRIWHPTVARRPATVRRLLPDQVEPRLPVIRSIVPKPRTCRVRPGIGLVPQNLMRSPMFMPMPEKSTFASRTFRTVDEAVMGLLGRLTYGTHKPV